MQSSFQLEHTTLFETNSETNFSSKIPFHRNALLPPLPGQKPQNPIPLRSDFSSADCKTQLLSVSQKHTNCPGGMTFQGREKELSSDQSKKSQKEQVFHLM